MTTGVGTGGGGGTRKKGGPAPYLAAPFHGSPLSALPSVYQFLSGHTLGSTALALQSEVTSGFLTMKNFPHRVRGNKSHTLPNSVAPLPC